MMNGLIADTESCHCDNEIVIDEYRALVIPLDTYQSTGRINSMDPEVVVNRVILVSNSFWLFVDPSTLLSHHSTTFPMLDGRPKFRPPGRYRDHSCQSEQSSLLMIRSD